MEHVDDTLRWNAKLDVFRPTTDFADLLKIVACYYEQYQKAVTFVGPWISRQADMMFLPPDRDQIKSALGKERAVMSFRARSAFVEAVMAFLMKTRGKRTLIQPNPSSHHSAQFPSGTFTITSVNDKKPTLRDDKSIRKEAKTLHKIEFFGAEYPVYVENLAIPVDQINFVIVRPKLGKLGTPCTNRWEVLLFKKQHGYLVDHVDSNLNPRWSGIM